MPQTLEMFKGHIALALAVHESVRPCVCSKIYLDTVLKFRILIKNN